MQTRNDDINSKSSVSDTHLCTYTHKLCVSPLPCIWDLCALYLLSLDEVILWPSNINTELKMGPMLKEKGKKTDVKSYLRLCLPTCKAYCRNNTWVSINTQKCNTFWVSSAKAGNETFAHLDHLKQNPWEWRNKPPHSSDDNGFATIVLCIKQNELIARQCSGRMNSTWQQHRAQDSSDRRDTTLCHVNCPVKTVQKTWYFHTVQVNRN